MSIQLERFTLAATDVEAMVLFYNTVFAAGFEPLPDQPLYIGSIGGIETILCPNSIAQVDAKQSRLQLRLRVKNVDAMLETAAASGGTFISELANENARIVGVRDPDGNSIELIEWFG